MTRSASRRATRRASVLAHPYLGTLAEAAVSSGRTAVVKTTGTAPNTTPSPTPGTAKAASTPVLASETPAVPQSVIDWLCQACLLYGVPFEYVIADPRLLPRESIRYFYIDLNWLNSLIDGAVSIGLSNTADSLTMMAHFEDIVQQALLGTAQVRARMRGKPAANDTGTDQTTGPITGLLLRSSAVSGWPGLEVAAYANEDGTGQLRLLRLDRLSDDVLIAMFDGVPHMVNILQPPESLHFGVRPTTDFDSGYMSFLRGLGYGGYPPGQQIPDVEAAVYMRGGSSKAGVLDVAKSAQSLKEKMVSLKALDSQDTFTSAEFAVQMVRAAGLQSFQWSVQPERSDAQ